MAEYNLKQFDIDKVFISKHAYKNVFTVLAKVNIDLATNHYHGTSMTMLFPQGSYTHQILKSKCKLDMIL